MNIQTVPHACRERLRDLTSSQPVIQRDAQGREVLLAQGGPGQVMALPLDQVVGCTTDTLQVQTPTGVVDVPKDAVLSTGGDLPASSALRGAGGGGLQGALSAGLSAATLTRPTWLPAMAGGLVGGYAGVRAGERTGSFAKALETGAAAGATSTIAAAASFGMVAPMLGPVGLVAPLVALGLLFCPQDAPAKLAAWLDGLGATRALHALVSRVVKKLESLDDRLHHHLALASTVATLGIVAATAPASLPAAAFLGVVGALAGAAGTLGGNRLAAVRDRQYGGFAAGAVARALTGQSLVPLAAGVASPLAGRQTSAGRQALEAFGAGAVAGAATGIPLGPLGAVVGALASGIASAVGTVLGPKIMQALRNLSTVELTGRLEKLLGSRVDVLGPTGRKAMAALGGAIAGGMAGSVASSVYGPAAIVVAAVAGAAWFALRAGEGEGKKTSDVHQQGTTRPIWAEAA